MIEVVKKTSPKITKKFKSKRAAFRSTKKDVGIPTSQKHETHTKNIKADGLYVYARRIATEYDFGNGKRCKIIPQGIRFLMVRYAINLISIIMGLVEQRGIMNANAMNKLTTSYLIDVKGSDYEFNRYDKTAFKCIVNVLIY